MLEYYTEFWRDYFDFSGRARRSAYWYSVLMNIIVITVLAVLRAFVPLAGLLYVVYGLAILIPQTSICVRRLHDIGRSGLWIFLVLIPVVGAVVLIIWYCTDSELYTNSYGPSEKYPERETRPAESFYNK